MPEIFVLLAVILFFSISLWLFNLIRSAEQMLNFALQNPTRDFTELNFNQQGSITPPRKDDSTELAAEQSPIFRSEPPQSETPTSKEDAEAPISRAPEIVPAPKSRGIGFGSKRSEKKETHAKTEGKSQRLQFHGNALIPQKVYESDSKNIKIDLHPTDDVKQPEQSPLQFRVSDDGLSLTLNIPAKINSEAQLEFELIGAGFEIGGEKKQRQSLAGQHLHYQWSCYFPNSGSHAFIIVARLINTRETTELGRLERTITVAQLDHLTKRQVLILATLAGVVSGGLAIFEVLHNLGVL